MVGASTAPMVTWFPIKLLGEIVDTTGRFEKLIVYFVSSLLQFGSTAFISVYSYIWM